MLTTVSLVGSGFSLSFQTWTEFSRWCITVGQWCSRLSEGGIYLAWLRNWIATSVTFLCVWRETGVVEEPAMLLFALSSSHLMLCFMHWPRWGQPIRYPPPIKAAHVTRGATAKKRKMQIFLSSLLSVIPPEYQPLDTTSWSQRLSFLGIQHVITCCLCWTAPGRGQQGSRLQVRLWFLLELTWLANTTKCFRNMNK